MARIAGQKRGETYPEAPKAAGAPGLLLKIGFDNSIDDNVQYGTGDFPVLRAGGGAPVAVQLTGYTKGNVILIGFSIAATDGFASGPTDTTIEVTPTVDLGAGPRVVHGNQPPASSPPFSMPPYTWLSFVIPVPDEVTADPIVGLQISTSGSDPSLIRQYGALLMAAEIDATAAGFLQAPTTFLDP